MKPSTDQPPTPRAQLRALLATWDALGPDEWRKTQLSFAVVLSRRARVISKIIDAVRALLKSEGHEENESTTEHSNEEATMGDKSRGLYNKFHVERTDGAHRAGKKHHGCEYFVLDLDHDPHARPALVAYAASARHDFPLLAKDLEDKIDWKSFGGDAAAKTPPALTGQALYELYVQANLAGNCGVDAYEDLTQMDVEMWDWMAQRLRVVNP